MNTSPLGERLDLLAKAAGLGAAFLPLAGVLSRWAAFTGHGAIPAAAAWALPLPDLIAAGTTAVLPSLPGVAILAFIVWYFAPLDRQLRRAAGESTASLDGYRGRLAFVGWIGRHSPSVLASRRAEFGIWAVVVVVMATYVTALADAPGAYVQLLAASLATATILVLIVKRAATFATVAVPVLALVIVGSLASGFWPSHVVVAQQITFGAGSSYLASGLYVVLGRDDGSYWLLECGSSGRTLEVARSQVLWIEWPADPGQAISYPTSWEIATTDARPSLGLQVDCEGL